MYVKYITDAQPHTGIKALYGIHDNETSAVQVAEDIEALFF